MRDRYLKVLAAMGFIAGFAASVWISVAFDGYWVSFLFAGEACPGSTGDIASSCGVFPFGLVVTTAAGMLGAVALGYSVEWAIEQVPVRERGRDA